MNRDTVDDCFKLIEKLRTGPLPELPYRIAAPAFDALSDLHDVIAQELPGGLRGRCEHCDTLIGNDDEGVAESEDGVLLCKSCEEGWRAEQTEIDRAENDAIRATEAALAAEAVPAAQPQAEAEARGLA